MVPLRPLISQKYFTATFLVNCHLSIRRGGLIVGQCSQSSPIALNGACVWSCGKEAGEMVLSLTGPTVQLGQLLISLENKYMQSSS